MTEAELKAIMYEVCDRLNVPLTHEESELIMHYAKAIEEKLKAGEVDAGVMRLEARIEELEKALKTIRDWDLPETGRFWDGDETQPMSYEAAYGSNGARDYMRKVAMEALAGKTNPNKQ